MARRIDIELTSARPDGTWTWRAAGALKPRGALDGTLLYTGAKAGDVVRAEAEFDMEGITVVSVEPPRAPHASDPNRIELLARPGAGTVTTELARDREKSGLGERRERRRPSQPHQQAPGGPSRRPDGPRERPAAGDRAGTRPPFQRAQGNGTGELNHRSAPREQPPQDGSARRERPVRPRPAVGPGRGGPGRPAPGGRRGETAELGEGKAAQSRSAPADAAARRSKRLNPGSAHRTAMLESLPAEQQPIAQQLLRGGIPAVRTALHFERERAREEGRPEPSTDGVLGLAESLLPRVKTAEWRDKAEAAIKAGDDLAMRDLRALVTGSDVARDEASRGLAVALREALDRRVEAQWAEWASEITASLDAGQLARALRLSSRPPDIAARFPADLATRLRDAASAALSPEKTPDQWLSLLQAVVASPIRRTVKPAGLPHEPTPQLLEAARQHCGRVPALAGLLGLTVPPPPGPARPMPGHKPVVLRPGSQRRARPRPPAQRAAVAKVRPRSSRAEDVPGTNGAGQPVGDASSEPAAVTAQPADAMGPPAELTAEPADAMGSPADVTAEPADATGLLAGATVEPPADAPNELANVRGEPADMADGPPADMADGPVGASVEPAGDQSRLRAADEAISAGPAYDQEAEPSSL